MNFRVFFAILFSLVIISCSDDDGSDQSIKGQGAYVACQGVFNASPGTVSRYDLALDTVEQTLFQNRNTALTLGNVLQSISFIDDQAYFVNNNNQNITIADAESFEQIGLIENLAQPRFIQEINQDKLYVSQWGSDGLSGSIKIVNPNTLAVDNEISLRNGPEKMLLTDGNVYVTNSNGFFRDSMVYVIDSESDMITDSIVVADNPVSIELDNENNIWVLCSGYTDFVDPSNSTNGALIKISNKEVVAEFELPNGVSQMVISQDDSRLYWLSFSGISYYDIDTGAVPTNSVATKYYYGLSISPFSGKLFAADAKDFNSAGQIDILNEDLSLDRSFTTGVTPQQVVFYQH